MLTPIKTNMTNLTLGAPANWDEEKEDKCIGLPCHFDNDAKVISSHWELTDEDRQKIADGALIKLEVFGQSHPPVAISIEEKQ